MHILLVDDSPSDIELTITAFRRCAADVSVHAVIGGQAALDYLFGRATYNDREKYLLPNLILLDLNMPDTDGLEVMRQLKADPSLASLPVIMLTASKHEKDMSRAYESGINSYRVKPNTFAELEKLIIDLHEWMQKKLQ